MIYINLLPVRAAQKREKLIEQLVILGAILILSVALCIGVYTVLLTKVSSEKDAIEAKKKEIEQLKKTIGEVDRFKKLQEELKNKLAVLDQLKEGKTGPVMLLDELAKAVPEKLWLTSFKETAGTINLSGIAFGEETVASFMRRLDESAFFQKVELQVIEQTKQGDTKLHKFTIVCQSEKAQKSASNTEKAPAKATNK